MNLDVTLCWNKSGLSHRCSYEKTHRHKFISRHVLASADWWWNIKTEHLKWTDLLVFIYIYGKKANSLNGCYHTHRNISLTCFIKEQHLFICVSWCSVVFQASRRYFVMTFIGSILWIGVFSYMMVWWAHQVGWYFTQSHVYRSLHPLWHQWETFQKRKSARSTSKSHKSTHYYILFVEFVQMYIWFYGGLSWAFAGFLANLQ